MHLVKAFNTVLWSSGKNVIYVPSTEHYLDTSVNATSKNLQWFALNRLSQAFSGRLEC